jgi:hypothetical protein
MDHRNPPTLTLLLAVAVLVGCGNEPDTGNGAQGDPAEGAPSASAPPGCLPETDVSSALGLEVREFRAGSRTTGDTAVCAYQGTDNTLGASVTTIVGPAERAEEVFGKMKESAALFLGAGAAPQAVAVGERGFAYGGGSKSEAAAVAGGRLYHAEVVSTASANLGDKQAGLVEIVRKLTGQ